MKIPISNRLLACASYVRQGSRVADIGTDHGYLGIYLLQKGIAAQVYASDLREQPLQNARENAARFGMTERMTFCRADGLSGVAPEAVDTVVCAGMGADCIIGILRAAPWLCRGEHRLILQPQSSGQDLRRFLAEQGFSILRETLAEDSGFLYTVLEAQYTGCTEVPEAASLYVSPQLLADGSTLLPLYLERLRRSMETTVAGLRRSEKRRERLEYYKAALRGIEEMERAL